MEDKRLPQARKGRGAESNPSPRFSTERRVLLDTGWPDDDDLPPLKTTVSIDRTRSIITRNDSPDVPFEQSINAFRGCEHGCVYCFARPTHAYLGLSPGLEFETNLWAKPDAAKRLEQELRHVNYRCRVIALGTNTDPYQPIERRYRITREILEVMADYNHPVSIVTKSALVLRDIDILAPMAARRLAKVALSITTLDRDLARNMEPRAASPARRLETIRELADAGIPVAVMAAPMIPALNDSELEAILEAARDRGASAAAYTLVRLPHEVKDLFDEWLATHYPNRAKHVLSLIRQARGGRLNDPNFGSRFVGSGPYATLLDQRFTLAVKRLGLNLRQTLTGLDTSQFARPARPGDQLALF
ncbi:MAG TPA: PA0069 family radical SAM protein [Telmatospirillum sp.]|nr:PA0069 family radical SAM protein [Telmatospirillum sp.]